MREIIVDNFCGGGGASTGIEQAIGCSVDIAINHDPAAIAMHKVNHPETEHYCESVWEVDPRKAANGRPVGLVWLSPDCKHFSKAKGGKPVEKHIRGLAWIAVKWAATVRPRVIMLENVEEFKTWGPLLIDGKPDPKQKGRTFNAFVNALRRQGYQVQHRELRACDYGAPTIRKRFFLVARCDGQPITWPKPTHGDPNSHEVKSGKLKAWRTAAEIIDWTRPCPSIFETSAEIKQKYGIKAVRPLSENTMRRIARGIQKFVIDNPNPFIISVNHKGEQFRGQDIDSPLQTVTAKNGWGIVAPTLIQYHSETANHEARGQTLDKPIMTLDTPPRYGLVTSHLLQMNNHCDGRSLDDPINTIVAGPGHWGEVRTFLLKHTKMRDENGCNDCNKNAHKPRDIRCSAKRRDMETCNQNQFRENSPDYPKEGRVSIEERIPRHCCMDERETILNLSSSSGLDSFSERDSDRNGFEPQGRQQEEQLPRQFGDCNTVGESETRIQDELKAPNRLCGDSFNSSKEPAKYRDALLEDSDTSGGFADNSISSGTISAFLTKFYGTGEGQRLEEPLATITTRDRFGLIMVRGQDYQIVDIGMRMLEPRELFNAQGFPGDYIIDCDSEGKSYPKSAQVARCGNAVPPPFAEALVRSNLPELCPGEKPIQMEMFS